MDLKKHPARESLREYLTGSIRPEAKAEVSFHLSFCRLCRESLDAVLLDVAYPERERLNASAGGHFLDKDFREFWGGTLQDPRQVEEMSRHCLQCRPCRGRRQRLLQEAQDSFAAAAVQAVIEVGLVARLVTGLSRRRRGLAGGLVALLGAGGAILLLNNMGGVPQVSEPQSVVHHGGASPSPAPTAAPVASATPQVASSKATLPRRSDDARQTLRPTLRTQPPTKAQGELALLQDLDLKNDPGTLYYRGADEESSRVRGRHEVVLARKGRTRLDIRLPEGSRSGTYVVSVQEPARLSTLAEGKGFSADGARLAVSIDMRRLSPGEYVLCITRRDEKTDDEEYLGHYPMRAIFPRAKAGRRED